MKRSNLAFCLLAVLLVAFAFHLQYHAGAAATNGHPVPLQTAAELPTLAIASPLAGFTQPVTITHAGDGSSRIFVVQQTGQIRIIKNSAVLTTPFLDISARISGGGERGLLGLAFAPGYASNGRFYVNYTNTAGNTVIARYTRNSSNPDLADAGSEQIVITIGQPFANHNGGQLAFGQDGFLYIGMGDGGSGGDPGNRAQNLNDLLGKLLRINVEVGLPATYTVPASNPFVGQAGFRPEIWAFGLRNPWRFSFDRQTGDLYLADVGQGAWEEVNFQLATSLGGENYGWRLMEGNHCFNPSTNCPMAGLTLPVAEYSHSLGCSVTGGYVYRGTVYPRMQGIYFYGDFCSGRIWGLSGVPGAFQNDLLLDTDLQISTFGEDEAGNLYVANYSGTIYSLVDSAPPPTPTPTPIPIASFQFSNPTFEATEGCVSATITVTRTGSTLSNRTDAVDYSIADAAANQMSDYTLVSGRLVFAAGETSMTFVVPINEDAFAEGDEAATLVLSNPSTNSVLGSPNQAQLVIHDNESSPGTNNPNDEPGGFVCQHYHDFLSRQSDAAGQAFWTDQIVTCGGEPGCVDLRRQNVSAAFFLSIEFQQTGFLVYRVQKSAFNQIPRYREFLRDTQQIGKGVVVGEAGWEAKLATNKQVYADEFVLRPAFLSQYPLTMTAVQYVNALNANAGGALSATERDQLVVDLNAGRETRATVLFKVAEDSDLISTENNRAFVLMQYFGYLRRNPDDAPDSDFTGYNFWLAKLNSFNGNFVAAEMVRSFLTSTEYRSRFGPQ